MIQRNVLCIVSSTEKHESSRKYNEATTPNEFDLVKNSFFAGYVLDCPGNAS